MSTEHKKVPPRIHKAPKRYADEQDAPGPAKKKKGNSGSAEKTMTLEKPTKKKSHQSTLNIQRPKPKPTARMVTDDEAIPGEKQQSGPDEREPDPTHNHTVPSGEESERHSPAASGHESNQDSDDDIEIIEDPVIAVESAEAELSWFFFFL